MEAHANKSAIDIKDLKLPRVELKLQKERFTCTQKPKNVK